MRVHEARVMRKSARRAMLVVVTALLWAGAAGIGCKTKPTPSGGVVAPAAPEAPGSDVRETPAEDIAAPDAPETTAAAPAPRATIDWAFAPQTLDVYRDTRVSFRITNTDALAPGWRCVWDFGDGSPRAEGCQLEHEFRGGQADHLVTLMVMDGERNVYLSSRTVPLERLPVVPLAEAEGSPDYAPDLSIPRRPARSETTFRLAVISDSNGPYGSVAQGEHVEKAIARIIDTIRPDLVVHDGDMIAGQKRGLSREHLQKMWAAYHDAVTSPLTSAGIPVAPVPGNHDASPNLLDREVYVSEWQQAAYRPQLTMVDDSRYPIRYSFTYGGSFFLVIDGAIGRVKDGDVRWIRRQLENTKIYTNRFVFTHVPLHKFTEVRFGDLTHPEEAHDPLRKAAAMDYTDTPGLDKHFRLYNLFLEHNVTLLFSGHYEVYYKGRYGALRVVSTGNIAGTRRALSGTRDPQGPSFVVVDVVDGRVKHVFAVRGPDYTRRYDESTLPGEVEVYRYDPTFTPGMADGPLPSGVFDGE